MASSQITQRAFNAGYLLEKHLPQLSQLLVKGLQNKTGHFAEGFIAGSNEYIKENAGTKSRFLEKVKKDFTSPGSNKTKKDKDEKEKG